MSTQKRQPTYYIGYLFDIAHSRRTPGVCIFQFDCVDPQREAVGVLEFEFPVERISDGEAEVFLRRGLQQPALSDQFNTYRVEGGEHYRLAVTPTGIPAKLRRSGVALNVIIKDPEDEDWSIVDWADDNLDWPLPVSCPGVKDAQQ